MLCGYFLVGINYFYKPMGPLFIIIMIMLLVSGAKTLSDCSVRVFDHEICTCALY